MYYRVESADTASSSAIPIDPQLTLSTEARLESLLSLLHCEITGLTIAYHSRQEEVLRSSARAGTITHFARSEERRVGKEC